MSGIVSRLIAAFTLTIAFAACHVFATAPTSARPTPVFEFDAADFVLGETDRPPPDDADWRPVRLPDNWYVSRPGAAGAGWYRMHFELPDGPYLVHTLYAPRGSARSTVFFVNGNRVATGNVQGDAQVLNWDIPMRFAVSPTLLHPGRNVLHVRVDAVATLRQGLSRLTFGPGNLVLPRVVLRQELQVESLRMFGGAALLAGLMAFSFWMRNRGDAIMFWFGVTALAWALMSLPWLGPQFGQHGMWVELFAFPLRFAYAAPLLVLCLRIAAVRAPALEAAVWLFTAIGAVLMPLGHDGLRGTVVTAWSVAYLLALAVLLVRLVQSGARQRDASLHVLVAAIALVAFLNGHDFARWMGWADFDNLTLAHFHVPLVLLAIGAAIVERHFKAVGAVERSRAELESRVAQKTREIEENYDRLRAAEHEGALARERSRIMADMHDGVGASLLGLLGMIQSRRVERPELERRVHECVQELRLAIDSLEPVDGDLGLVLGNVRHRMREAIEESGVRFVWQVGDLPPVDYLTPRTILAIQRVVAEAMANALRHSQATAITVSTRTDAGARRLLVQVADDGRGFDPATVRRGRGLDNFVNRLRGIGGTVAVESAPGAGTSVTFALPLPGQPLPARQETPSKSGRGTPVVP